MEAIFYEDDLPEEQGLTWPTMRLYRISARPRQPTGITGRCGESRSARGGHATGVGAAEGTRVSREGVLAVLRGATTALTIPQIADELGVHPDTVRFHLDTLVTEGRVERVEPDRRRPGRPPLIFALCVGWTRRDRRYRVLAEISRWPFAGTATPAPRHSRPARRGHGG